MVAFSYSYFRRGSTSAASTRILTPRRIEARSCACGHQEEDDGMQARNPLQAVATQLWQTANATAESHEFIATYDSAKQFITVHPIPSLVIGAALTVSILWRVARRHSTPPGGEPNASSAAQQQREQPGRPYRLITTRTKAKKRSANKKLSKKKKRV